MFFRTVSRCWSAGRAQSETTRIAKWRRLFGVNVRTERTTTGAVISQRTFGRWTDSVGGAAQTVVFRPNFSNVLPTTTRRWANGLRRDHDRGADVDWHTVPRWRNCSRHGRNSRSRHPPPPCHTLAKRRNVNFTTGNGNEFRSDSFRPNRSIINSGDGQKIGRFA